MVKAIFIGFLFFPFFWVMLSVLIELMEKAGGESASNVELQSGR